MDKESGGSVAMLPQVPVGSTIRAAEERSEVCNTRSRRLFVTKDSLEETDSVSSQPSAIIPVFVRLRSHVPCSKSIRVLRSYIYTRRENSLAKGPLGNS